MFSRLTETFLDRKKIVLFMKRTGEGAEKGRGWGNENMRDQDG